LGQLLPFELGEGFEVLPVKDLETIPVGRPDQLSERVLVLDFGALAEIKVVALFRGPRAGLWILLQYKRGTSGPQGFPGAFAGPASPPPCGVSPLPPL
jgi:hypothetical protein